MICKMFLEKINQKKLIGEAYHRPIPIAFCDPPQCDSQFEILKWLEKAGPFSLNFQAEMRPSLSKLQKLAANSSRGKDPKK